MHKNTLFLICGLFVVAIGIGSVKFLQKKVLSPSPLQSVTTQENLHISQSPERKVTYVQGNIKNILEQENPSVCSVVMSGGFISLTGTAYVAHGNVRFDGKTSLSVMPISGHLISTGGYLYAWIDNNKKQGYKIAFNQDILGPQDKQTINFYNQKISYSCETWKEDTSLFMVPSDIVFTLFTSFKQTGL